MKKSGLSNLEKLLLEGSAIEELPRYLSIPEIAHRWGVESLDAVRAVMDQLDEPQREVRSWSYLDSYELERVERVERLLIMPGAVDRYLGKRAESRPKP